MDIAKIEAAAARIAGHARRTPLLETKALNDLAGRRVLIKPECLQHTGSFKYRGGWAAVSALSASERADGVLAFSSGNHAQGIAIAAAGFGVPAVIIMPSDAPRAKIDGTRTLGAEVVLYDRAQENREEIGARLQAERGLTLIPPYDHPEVIAGQGTCGLEIAEDAHAMGVETADLLVCCGGGGLASGVALACEARAAGLRVRPAEPAGFDDMTRSLASGSPQRNSAMTGSLCDAVLTPTPGELTFPILQRLAGPGLVVSDEEALSAVAQAFRHLRLVVEPGGAIALAAALFRRDEIDGDAVICILTGGNVDASVFARAIQAA